MTPNTSGDPHTRGQKGWKERENHGNTDGQAPRGIWWEEVCVCICVCVFCSQSVSQSVLSHCWAGQADRNRLLGGPAGGAQGGMQWACSEKYRKGISCCDRTHPGTLLTQYFNAAKFSLPHWRTCPPGMFDDTSEITCRLVASRQDLKNSQLFVSECRRVGHREGERC